jgi:hypothetical protein
METELTFKIAITCVGALGGWMLKVIWESIKDVKHELKELSKEMNQDFVRRDDFTETILRIENMFNRIFDKLDNKADK